MFITLSILKNRKWIYFALLIFFVAFPNNIFFGQAGKPTFQIPSFSSPSQSTPVESSPGTPGQPGQPPAAAQTQPAPEMDTEFIPQKFPVLCIGAFAGLHFFNTNPRSSNTIPEWDGFQPSVGGFVDFRISKRFAFRATYEFDVPYNIMNLDPAKSLHAVNFLARYILAYKHQLWIGLGFTLHILDSFANAELNSAAVTAGYLTDANEETQRRFILFFTIYLGYMLQISDTIVLDVQTSYGLLNTSIKSWRYNSFRINIGVGFKL